MAKQPSFPMTIMAGSTAIKIYFSPLSTLGPKLDGESTTTESIKKYESYVLSYYSGGKRIRIRFNSLTDARDKANAVKTALLNDDSSALKITGEESLIYARSKHIAQSLRMPLDQIAREYVEARPALGKMSLQRMC